MIIAIFACGFMLAALTYTTWTVFTEHQLDHHHATTIRENNTKRARLNRASQQLSQQPPSSPHPPTAEAAYCPELG